MTQYDKILKFMEKNGRISQRDAYKMGIYRLASRICDMKKAGFPIVATREKVINADETVSSVAFYSLGGKK